MAEILSAVIRFNSMPYKNPEDEKACRLRNRHKKLAYMKVYHAENRERDNKRSSKWKEDHPEQFKATQKAYGKRVRPERRIYERGWRQRKRESDSNQRILECLRQRVNGALGGARKSARTFELLGCDILFLRGFLEARFLPGMTWKNRGKGPDRWHLEHHIPCAEFDLRDPAQQRQCFHYSNLRPMWEFDNLRKGSKRPPTHQAELI